MKHSTTSSFKRSSIFQYHARTSTMGGLISFGSKELPDVRSMNANILAISGVQNLTPA